MKNNLFTIRPYKLGDIWVFDEPELGLKAEAFVGGASEAITRMVEKAKIKTPDKGFTLVFSDKWFPDYAVEVDKIDSESQALTGTFYEWIEEGMIFWLCPVLNLYYPISPKKLFIKVVG